MPKKIAIIGRGTAGALSAMHFVRYCPDDEIEWHYDPNISPQAVGEGGALDFPRNLANALDFNHLDLKNIDGTFKSGILKPGWNPNGSTFFHEFPPPNISYHFNALELQNYIFEKIKDKVKLVEHNTNADDIDANHIIDCSGRPTELNDEFVIPKYIPVNAVHVTQCFWDYPRFDYTIAAARPHGWVFLIPLQNRCSVGYLYNHTITDLNEIQKDVENIFDEYNLTPSEKTNSFHFGNYYRRKNYSNRVVYNGNASFFLEPLEATSISVMILIQRNAYDVFNQTTMPYDVNLKFCDFMTQTENMIMMHYFAGSKFKSAFWDYAQERGTKCMESAMLDSRFANMHIQSKNLKYFYECNEKETEEYSTWWLGSFMQNIKGLGIKEKLNKFI